MFGGSKAQPWRTLDEQIEEVRARAKDHPREAAIDLITLLSVRGILAVQEDREADALVDRRTVAGLLRDFDGQPLPVPVATARMAWMALASGEAGQGRLADALDAGERAADLMEGLEPDDLDACGAFFSDVTALYNGLRLDKRPAEALRAARAAGAVARALVGADRRRFGAVAGLAGINEALALAALGDLTEAVDVISAVADRYREDGGQERGLLLALGSQAGWLRRLDRLDESLAVEAEALVLARRRAVDPAGQRALAVRLTSMLHTRLRLGQLQPAEDAGTEALGILLRQTTDEPVAQEMRVLASALNSLAVALARAERPDAAARVAASTVQLHRDLCSAPWGDPGALANALGNHADFVLALGQADRSLLLAREALAIFEGLHDPVRFDRYERAVLDTLCQAQAAVGDHLAAVASAERAVALAWEETQRRPDFRAKLVESLDVLADRRRDAGDLPGEGEARDEATALRANS